MLKSVREAGVNTRWVFGDPDYEAALAAFVARALDPGGAFLPSFRAFEAAIAADGAANGLIQTALKLTIPGVPDIYQGAELWEQSLVDPDNRRPVDFARRAALLADPAAAPPKLALIARLLGLRREKPELFAAGSYEPLPGGPGVCAFAAPPRIATPSSSPSPCCRLPPPPCPRRSTARRPPRPRSTGTPAARSCSPRPDGSAG